MLDRLTLAAALMTLVLWSIWATVVWILLEGYPIFVRGAAAVGVGLVFTRALFTLLVQMFEDLAELHPTTEDR